MKKRILMVGLAALVWGVLYALGIVDLGTLVAIPIFGAISYNNYYEGTQSEIHRGGWMRIMQVDQDGATWGSTDWMGNDAGSIYELGYLDDLELIKTETANPIIDVNGSIIGHSVSQGALEVKGTVKGVIAKYQALGAGNGVYYADKIFGSGMDRILFKAAVYFANDIPNAAGTNGAFLKYVFWTGRFITDQYGLKASATTPRLMSFRFLPAVLQSKSGNYRDGGQIYQRRSVATLQANSAAETWDAQVEVTA